MPDRIRESGDANSRGFHFVRAGFAALFNVLSASKAYSLLISVGLCLILWLLVSATPRITTIPLIIGLSACMGFLLHAVMAIYLNKYKPTLCRIRLSVNHEVTLIYRSWWPRTLSTDEIKCFAVDAAMESAQSWYRSHQETPKFSITEQEAFSLTIQYLAEFKEVDEPITCPICLETIEGGASEMRICKHTYHEDCLVGWFHRSGKFICPYCREDHNICIPDSVHQKFLEKTKPVISIVSTEIQLDGDE